MAAKYGCGRYLQITLWMLVKKPWRKKIKYMGAGQT